MRQWISTKLWFLTRWIMRVLSRFAGDDITGGKPKSYCKLTDLMKEDLDDMVMGKHDDITGGQDG